MVERVELRCQRIAVVGNEGGREVVAGLTDYIGEVSKQLYERELFVVKRPTIFVI